MRGVHDRGLERERRIDRTIVFVPIDSVRTAVGDDEVGIGIAVDVPQLEEVQFRSGVEVRTGTATTALLVQGDARVTGILTVGTSSITLDPSNNSINVGTGITISGATGKIEATEIRTVGTTGAFFPPVLTTTQRDALSVTEGAMIFNTTTKKLEFYDGTSWQSLPGMSLGLTVALDG
mgnify:CR=1 FL=1